MEILRRNIVWIEVEYICECPELGYKPFTGRNFFDKPRNQSPVRNDLVSHGQRKYGLSCYLGRRFPYFWRLFIDYSENYSYLQ